MSYSSQGVEWSDVTDLFKTAGKGALDLYGQKQQAAGANAALQAQLAQQQAARGGGESGFSKYLPWIAVGGGVLLLFFMMKKKG